MGYETQRPNILQFSMWYLNLMLYRKMGYSPLNVENNRVRVTNYVMFAYTHEKINILLSVLSIFFLFYDFSLNTQGLVYLEFVKVSNGPPQKRASFREMQCMNICCTVVLYTDMSRSK